MQKLLAIAAVALFALPMLTHASNAPRSNSDCAELLERWAGDPKAAPKSAINACKDQLAATPPAERMAEPAAAPAELANLAPAPGPMPRVPYSAGAPGPRWRRPPPHHW